MIFNDEEEIDFAIKKYCEISKIDYEFIRNEFFKIFDTDVMPVVSLKRGGVENLKIYRTRPCCEVKDIINVNSFSYPPKEIRVKMGRANWVGKSVFYGSDSPYTSLFESKNVKVSNEYYISQWGFDFKEMDEKHEFIQIKVMGVNNLSQNNPWSIIIPSSNEIIDVFKEKFDNNKANLYLKLIEKISRLFVEFREDKYHLTAFIADNGLFLEGEDGKSLYFPILIYPSVENNLDTCNFAINPWFVDKYMRLKKVIKVKIKEIGKDKIEIISEEVGLPNENNKIDWYKRSYNIKKAAFSLNSIIFDSGVEISEPNIENLIFIYKDQIIELSDLLRISINNELIEKLHDFGNDFEYDGIIAENIIDFICSNYTELTIENKGVKDKVKDIKFSIKQPIDIREIKF